MRSFWSPISRCIFCTLFIGAAWFSSEAIAEDASPNLTAATKSRSKGRSKPSSSFYVPTSSTPASSRSTQFSRPPIAVAAVMGYQYVGLGVGVESWVTWPKDVHLGLSYTKASGELMSKSDANIGLQEILDIEMAVITPTVRYFTSDSFYLTMGYAMAKVSGKFGYKTTGGTTQNTFVSYKSDMSFLQFGFGSTWNLITGNVIVLDWIGYAHLLGQSASVGADNPASDGSTVEQNVQYFEGVSTQEHLKKQLKDQSSYFGLMLRFGIQF